MMRNNRNFRLFALAFTAFLLFSCAGVGSNSSDQQVKCCVVTTDEYNAASDVDKELYDKLDAAVAALDRLHNEGYFAIVAVSNGENPGALFANTILISNEKIDEEAIHLEKFPKCKVCAGESAQEWLKELLVKYDEFGIYVKREGDCVVLVCDKS